MAELLVYNKTHWWDELSTNDQDKYSEIDRLKFQGIYKKGDVVDIKKDGHYTINGELQRCNMNAFCIVRMTGRPEDYHYLLAGDKTEINAKMYRRKRAKNIDPVILVSDINDGSTVNIEGKETWQPSLDT